MIWTIANKSILFMLSNIGSKGLAALAQLYAIFIFTKIHTQDDAAIIFLLIGYAIWFQVFEFGLAQTLQNKYNEKKITTRDMFKVHIWHYFFMWIIALFVMTTSVLTDFLLPSSKQEAEAVKAFSTGAAIYLIASNNTITQRLLLILNRGMLGNVLIIVQSLLAIIGLSLYYYFNKVNITVAVILYLAPQILVYIPVLIFFSWRRSIDVEQTHKINFNKIVYYSARFSGLGLMSAMYLGLDYYFAAHFLGDHEVISYHLVTRLFFISYIAYYAYSQHSTRHLSVCAAHSQWGVVYLIYKDSVLIGLAAVFLIYSTTLILNQCNVFDVITNGNTFDYKLLSAAFIYYIIRVFRDVALVIAGGLGWVNLMYQVYLLEILIGLIAMLYWVPVSGAEGLLLSMSLASLMGLFIILYKVRIIGTKI
jgi:hypothetical protein